MNEQRKQAHQVCAMLEAFGFNVMVSGGYPRDLFYGETPKDVDIAVYNIGDKTTELATITEVFRKAGWLTHEFLNAPSLSEPSEKHIFTVLKLEHDVDVICFNPDITTEREVLDTYDYNINQFVATWQDLIYDLPPGILFKGEDGGVLRRLNDSDTIRETRAQKMEDYANRVGWLVDADSHKVAK